MPSSIWVIPGWITRSGDASGRAIPVSSGIVNQPNTTMRKIVLTYGLIAGAIFAATMFISLPFREQIGLDRSQIIGYTTMVIAFLMVFFGVKTYRDQIAGGQVTFGRATQVGLLIMAVAIVCYVISWEIVFYGFTPDYIDAYVAQAIDNVRASGATEAEISAQAAEMAAFAEAYKKPLINIAYTLIEPLPVGLLFTLISAGVLSRKKPAQNPAIAPR
jgi:Protein of unknown function (DUF4199)